MNPNEDSSAGMRLPQPVSQADGVQPLPGVETQASTAAAEASTVSQGVPSLGAAMTPSTGTPLAQDASTAAGPAVADDGDTIEKEWVLKAKQIIQSTQADPYQQNRQLAAFKADYLKKRYNKIVKLSE